MKRKKCVTRIPNWKLCFFASLRGYWSVTKRHKINVQTHHLHLSLSHFPAHIKNHYMQLLSGTMRAMSMRQTHRQTVFFTLAIYYLLLLFSLMQFNSEVNNSTDIVQYLALKCICFLPLYSFRFAPTLQWQRSEHRNEWSPHKAYGTRQT